MRDRFLRLSQALSRGVHERDEALKMGLLALLAGESLFLLGAPGTAKSLVARRLKAALEGARSFEYLMGRFSTPEEIFGPLSIVGLRDRDVFERRTAGYLPEADVAFLDEVWRASPPIQNTLLTVLNEKRFRNGDHEAKVPLKLLVAASNTAPAGEESAQAFWDRFTVRLVVNFVAEDEAFRRLVADTSDLYEPKIPPQTAFTMDEWKALQLGIDLVELPEAVLASLVALRHRLNTLATPILVTDRRWKKAARILRACAVVHGRAWVDGQDLGLLAHILWDHPDQKPVIQQQLEQVLQEEGWPSPVALSSWEDRIEELRNDLQALTRKERRGTRPRPILAEGEYFTLLGFPGTQTARIWAQDYNRLTETETEGELFFFSPAGPYQSSDPHGLRRTGGFAEVEVDGRLYALESQPEEVVEWEKVPANGPGLKAWETRAVEARQQLEADRQAVDSEAEAKRAEGTLHVFCPAYVDVCAEGLVRDSADLGDLIVRLEALIETRDPG